MKNFLPRLFQGKEIRSADIEEIKATEEYQSLEARNQLTVEEKAQLKRYLQNINPDDKNSPYAPENVEPPDYGPITFWDKRELIVSNKDVTPDGLAMSATKTLSLMYALTIEDAVVFVDPNTELDEKVIAGLFLIPSPAKFGKPFLKHADDVGGAANAGRKGKIDGDSLAAKGIDNAKLSPSNYPNPDPSMSIPPVRYESKTIGEVIRMRQGKGPTTKMTHGDRNIEAHHRQQVPIKNGGRLDELEQRTHRGGGNHTRHNKPSQLTPSQRAKEIREHYKERGKEYILPGEGI